MPAPEQPPESIILGAFRGVRNTVGRERLAPEELEAAVNVDIDDAGQARRRRGYDLKLAGNFHSLRAIGGRVLGVKDGVLGQVNTDYSFTSLGVTVGNDPLSYTQVDATTYFSSIDASGKIVGDTVSDWGAADDAGEWLSPVNTPTDTLGEIFGYQITAPPYAQEIEAYSGRIYLLAGKYLWATELFLYDYISKTKNFMQFEAEGTLLAAVNDGLYVGTTNAVYFLKGTLSDGFRVDQVLDVGAVRGSMVRVPAKDVHPAGQQGPMAESLAVVFMTASGICAGFDGGQVFNLTRDRVAFPSAQSAAALYREDSGVSSYVAVTDSGGGQAANARIGDFVDAEIVRPGG